MGGRTLSRGHSTCKDPKMGALLAPSRNSKVARMAAGQGASRRGAGDEAHDSWVVERVLATQCLIGAQKDCACTWIWSGSHSFRSDQKSDITGHEF